MRGRRRGRGGARGDSLSPWLWPWVLLPLAGAGAGILGSVLGIGGGVFLVPALVLLFDFPMTQAAAAGLVSVIAATSSISASNVETGMANMRLGIVLEVATVSGALAGAFLAGVLDPRFLVGLFGALLLGIAPLLWKGRAEREKIPHDKVLGPLDGRYHDPATRETVSYRVRRLPLGLSVSFGAGALSGLLGVGGGVFKVPALHLFCGLPMKASAATSGMMVGVTAAASAFLYFRRGDVNALPTAAIALGALAGSAAGNRLNARLKDSGVRRLFAVLLVYVSWQMIQKALHG